MARPRTPSALFPGVFFDMDPDPEDVRRDILLLQQRIQNHTKPLQYAKQIIVGDVRRAFLTETDPIEGDAWPALSERASRVPRSGILRVTGSLYRNMVNRNNYGVTREGVYLNQSRIPFYAAFHQQDDSTALRGEGMSREKVMAEFKRLVGRGFRADVTNKHQRAKEVLEQAKINVKADMQFEGGGGIPRRRFIGPSPEAQKKIVTVFDEWAREAIIIYKRGNILVRRAR